MVQIYTAILVLGVAACAKGATTTDGVDFSHGMHILGKFARNYVETLPGDVKLGEGVHLVSTRSENDARGFSDDGSVIGVIENYLKSHEVRIRLPELLPGEGFGRAFQDAVDGVNSSSAGTARGKGGKGGGGMGGIMIMGMMMGKMMAALGLGGVGLIAMKALMVSALALMLSTIIGIKKLVSSHDDEGGHTVIHASHGHDHHRRKREAADLAYSSWAEFQH